MGYNVKTGQYYNDLNPNNYDPNAASAFYAIGGNGTPQGDPTFGGYNSLDAYNQSVASQGDRYNYYQQWAKAHGIPTGPANGAVTRGISNNAPGVNYGALWAANAAKRAAKGNTLQSLYQRNTAPAQGVNYQLAKQIWDQAAGDPAKQAALLNGFLGHMGGQSGQYGMISALRNMGVNPDEYFNQFGGFASWAAQNPGTSAITKGSLPQSTLSQLGLNMGRRHDAISGGSYGVGGRFGGVGSSLGGGVSGGNNQNNNTGNASIDNQLYRSNTGPYANGSWVPPSAMGSFDTSKYKTFNPNLINSAAPNAMNDPTGSMGSGPPTTMSQGTAAPSVQSTSVAPSTANTAVAPSVAPTTTTAQPSGTWGGSGGWLGRQGKQQAGGDRAQQRWGNM